MAFPARQLNRLSVTRRTLDEWKCIKRLAEAAPFPSETVGNDSDLLFAVISKATGQIKTCQLRLQRLEAETRAEKYTL